MPVTEDNHTPDEPTEGDSQQPEIDISKLPSLPTHPRSQSMPGTNIGRWATFGCVAVMLILVVLLVVGVNLTKRTVWMAYARAQQRVVESLPGELPSAERLRIERNLQRLRARLDMTADPMPLMGSFLSEVTTVFDDDRLTVDEVVGLNVWIEDVLDGTGAEAS
jgi:hypothetical protein